MFHLSRQAATSGLGNEDYLMFWFSLTHQNKKKKQIQYAYKSNVKTKLTPESPTLGTETFILKKEKAV